MSDTRACKVRCQRVKSSLVYRPAASLQLQPSYTVFVSRVVFSRPPSPPTTKMLSAEMFARARVCVCVCECAWGVGAGVSGGHGRRGVCVVGTGPCVCVCVCVCVRASSFRRHLPPVRAFLSVCLTRETEAPTIHRPCPRHIGSVATVNCVM